MSIELSDEVRRRAAAHAALAEPFRLLIVDQLRLGDLSPSRLGQLLGLSSNLLAHHLRVLQDAGLVARVRSEGDRRRSYLRLVPEALGSLNSSPAGLTPAQRVVFVCTANSARSQLAAALWQQASVIPATSAGTHPAAKIHPGAIATAKRHGLRLRDAIPRQLTDVLADADLVITVCDSAHEELAELQPVHWSVPDPVPAADDAAFDAAFDELARRVQQVSPQMTAAAVAASSSTGTQALAPSIPGGPR